jgi:hypothetical protein
VLRETWGQLVTHHAPRFHGTTWMRETSLLAASTTCTAHDIQGSKEWMVRRTSTGRAGSKTGVPISDCSQGPRCPRASRGEPFQTVATTAC